ncbi:hypothetical protein [Sphingobacterium bambusae]|uniref:DUF4906 domain-containing protein n=1 Tax=Sphingobacterium bambusae TaxID=662858 RepID=A0ABW6BFM5_9SPHI|nr:hypothetical protein [Sphingobacterium bambusae]WPL46997.1 hypothetical protein SCB77_13600 [Sphingobacterium bambusae]
MNKLFRQQGGLCVLVAVLILTACAKDPVKTLEEDASLVVQVSGLEDFILEEDPIALTAKSASAAVTSNTTRGGGPALTRQHYKKDGVLHELYTSSDYDIDFEIKKSHPLSLVSKDRKIKTDGLSMSAGSALVARQPIGADVRYRLLMYRENETTPIVNVEGVGATFPAVAIASGFNYRWIAVSTNESGSSPTVTNNVVSAAQIANKDFLYASGTILTQFGENYLNIVFNRYSTRIQLTVDSRGMFGNIAGNSNVSFVIAQGGTLSETGDFNVRDSSFSNFQEVALSSNNMTSTNPALRVGTIYTVRPRAVVANSLRLRLNPLNLTLDDGATRTFADNTVGFGSAFSPVRGSSYDITARLIESGVQVTGSTLRWARSNLRFVSTAAAGFRYRFLPHPVNTPFDINLDMWNFATTTPTGTTFNNVDMCASVYPAGTWRLPTAAEYQALPNPSTLERYTPLLLGGVGLVANWERSASQPANSAYTGSDQLRLPFYGFRTTTNTRSQQPGLLAVLVNGQGHYYSVNYTGTSTNPTAIRPTFFRMNYSGLDLLGLLNLADGYSQEVVSNLSGTSFNQGRNVRCVRAIVNNS